MPVDYIVCNRVLGRIPDDVAAVKESISCVTKKWDRRHHGPNR